MSSAELNRATLLPLSPAPLLPLSTLFPLSSLCTVPIHLLFSLTFSFALQILGTVGLSAGAFLVSPYSLDGVPDIQLTAYPKVCAVYFTVCTVYRIVCTI